MGKRKRQMKWYTKVWAFPLMLVNFFASIVFILCAFSHYIPAAKFPVISLAGLAFPFALAAVVAFLVFWFVFYRRYCWLSFLTLLICSWEIYTMCPINLKRQIPPKEGFKVLSYNVYSGNVTSSNVKKDNEVLNYIGKLDADIVCLQECNNEAFRAYEKEDGWMHKYPYRSYDVGNYSSPKGHLVVCLSKYPILSRRIVSFEGSDNGAQVYEILVEGDTVALFNCHLQSFGLNDEDKDAYNDILTRPKDNVATSRTKTLVKKLRDAGVKRALQADGLRKEIDECSAPYIIVCGDFNDTPLSYTHHVLTRKLSDAHTRSGNGFDFSYNRNHMYFRIDHILASRNLTPYACKVDRSIKISDHYPIHCTFVKKEK